MAAGGVGTGIEPPVYRSSVRTAGPETASQGSTPAATCDNCGAPAAAAGLARVRRVYLEVAADGSVRQSPPEAVVEVWCAPCRTLYLHEPAGT